MDDATQLTALSRTIDETLGPTVLGTYLHGSAVRGGLRPASDLDLLVVTREELTHPQRQNLVEGMLAVSGSGHGARPAEVLVVRQGALRPWRYPPVVDLQYGEWLRDRLEADGAAPPTPMPDVALLLSVALAADHPLRGPRLRDLVDPVPVSDLVRATRDGLPDLVASLEGDERNVVLTLARVWATVETGRILAKDEAADWALARLAPSARPPLAHARHLYLTSSYADECWPVGVLDQVPDLAVELVAHIDRAAAYSPP